MLRGQTGVGCPLGQQILARPAAGALPHFAFLPRAWPAALASRVTTGESQTLQAFAEITLAEHRPAQCPAHTVRSPLSSRPLPSSAHPPAPPTPYE